MLVRKFEALPASKLNSDGTALRVELTVKYFLDEAVDPLISRKQRAVFIRDATSGKFLLDENASELTQAELNIVYNIDSMNRSDFIKYNTESLREIAEKATPSQKEWLRAFLMDAKMVPGASELLHLMNR